jgi:hypothetical protein
MWERRLAAIDRDQQSCSLLPGNRIEEVVGANAFGGRDVFQGIKSW